ncbi:MAG: hypothetical protein ACI82H_001261, partial [Alphaproteobacteria bacterium]
MSEEVSEWMAGVLEALKAGGFSDDNNIA